VLEAAGHGDGVVFGAVREYGGVRGAFTEVPAAGEIVVAGLPRKEIGEGGVRERNE
jgi:hypothetical protein